MIAIVGGGISGLSLAWYLQEKGTDYQLFEKNTLPGGYLKTIEIQGYQLECGPNSILLNEETKQLIDAIELSDSLQYAAGASKNRYIYKKKKIRKLPSKPLDLLFSTFFSLKAKLAIFSEMKNHAAGPENETLYDFTVRHFNKEVAEYALNPFVAGIYAGDPKKLITKTAFPVLKKYEKEYGSVLKGFSANKNGQRRKSISFKGGIASFANRLANEIENIHLDCEVKNIRKTNGGYQLDINDKEGSRTVTADKVVYCLTAYQTADLLPDGNKDFAELLKGINYPPMAVVHTAYPKSKVGHQLNGFGALHPKVEKRFSAGTIWTSSIFPDKCPTDTVLFTSFVGGDQYIKNYEHTDDEIQLKVQHELKRMYDIHAVNPIFQHIKRWDKTIPQYDMHLLPVIEKAPAFEKENIYFNSNWLGGIAIGDCIKKSKELAEKLG